MGGASSRPAHQPGMPRREFNPRCTVRRRRCDGFEGDGGTRPETIQCGGVPLEIGGNLGGRFPNPRAVRIGGRWRAIRPRYNPPPPWSVGMAGPKVRHLLDRCPTSTTGLILHGSDFRLARRNASRPRHGFGDSSWVGRWVRPLEGRLGQQRTVGCKACRLRQRSSQSFHEEGKH